MKKLVNLNIKGMHCRSCTVLAKKELSKLEGVDKIEIDHESGEGSVLLDENLSSKEDVMGAIERAGYSPEISGIVDAPVE